MQVNLSWGKKLVKSLCDLGIPVTLEMVKIIMSCIKYHWD